MANKTVEIKTAVVPGAYVGPLHGTPADVQAVVAAFSAPNLVSDNGKLVVREGTGVKSKTRYNTAILRISAALTVTEGHIKPAVLAWAGEALAEVKTVADTQKGVARQVAKAAGTYQARPANGTVQAAAFLSFADADAPAAAPAGWFRSKRASKNGVTVFFTYNVVDEATARAAFAA